MVIKIWLDDERQPPDATWVWCDSAAVVIRMLKELNGKIEIISLDHDLGDDVTHGTGYDVVKFIEEQVATNDNFIMPRSIKVHSQNPVGRRNIDMALKAITGLMDKRLGDKCSGM